MSAPALFGELEDVAPEFGGGDGALNKLRARFGGETDTSPRAGRRGSSEAKPATDTTPRRLSAAQAQSGVSPDKPAPLPRDIAALDRTTLPPLFGEDPEQDVFPDTGRDATGKLQQMQELQHLLHNPLSIDLRQAMLDHSSSRAEVAARLGDLRHRQSMIAALSGVIGEEIEQLQTLLAAMEAPKS